MKSVALALLASTLAVAGCDVMTQDTETPAVGTSSDLSEFEGARAGQGEMGIQALGYELIRTDGLDAFWFNRDTGACAKITTADGRYAAIEMLASDEC